MRAALGHIAAFAALSAAIAGCAAPAARGGAAGAHRPVAAVAAEDPAPQPPARSTPGMREVVIGELVIGEMEPATRGVLAADLVRAPGTVATYEAFEGVFEGAFEGVSEGGFDGALAGPSRTPSNRRRIATVVERIERREAASSDARPGLARIESRDGRVVERMDFAQGASGALDLVQVDSISDRSRSLFAAPLPFAADLAADGVLAGQSPMTVRTLPKLAKRAAGSARRTLRIVGECGLSLRGEALRATVVETEFDIDLDAATARVRSRQFVVPGRGVVAEVRSESREVLAVFRTRTDETTVLVRVEADRAP